MESLRGKIALITGSSSGIGEATALLFAKLGCRLAIHGRDKAKLDKVADKCKAFGLTDDQLIAITADLAKTEDVTRLMEETLSHFGTLHILVNNAGRGSFGCLETVTMEEFDQIMAVNLRSVVQLCKMAIPHLKKNKGCVVNVSSTAGSLRAFSALMSYCVSKAALDMLTSCLAIELGSFGVRVNAVNPGTIKTPIHQKAGIDPGDMEQYWSWWATTNPLARCGESEEVAQSIAFLASDAASFISGALLPVDGGQVQTTAWYTQELEYLKELRGAAPEAK